MRFKTTLAGPLVIAVVAVSGCGGSSKGPSEKFHTGYTMGCTKSGQTQDGCECIYKQLTEKQGQDSAKKLTDLSRRTQEAVKAQDISKIPAELRRATIACKSKLKATG